MVGGGAEKKFVKGIFQSEGKEIAGGKILSLRNVTPYSLVVMFVNFSKKSDAAVFRVEIDAVSPPPRNFGNFLSCCTVTHNKIHFFYHRHVRLTSLLHGVI
jgi:hypothetical protein